jgi:hypothetical protein
VLFQAAAAAGTLAVDRLAPGWRRWKDAE